MAVHFEDHSEAVLVQLKEDLARALEKVGIVLERAAKALCPVGTVESTGKKGYRGGTLRNSITHEVDNLTLQIGSNVEYAPYVELGTGPNFEPPPDWETFDAPQGSGSGHGYVRARPFLRTAVEDNKKAIEETIKQELIY